MAKLILDVMFYISFFFNSPKLDIQISRLKVNIIQVCFKSSSLKSENPETDFQICLNFYGIISTGVSKRLKLCRGKFLASQQNLMFEGETFLPRHHTQFNQNVRALTVQKFDENPCHNGVVEYIPGGLCTIGSSTLEWATHEILKTKYLYMT